MKLKKFVSDNGGVTRDFHQIDPRLLQVRPDFNIRDLTTPAAREKLDILKAQVKAEGVLEPLEIEFDGETPWINEGHRRHIVVMELIGEGHDFKTIPCVQERSNIKADKRTLHMLMRSKEDYEPLEYAKGVDRMVNVYGWDRGQLAEHLGFKSKASIDGYLDMLAMPEPVKEHVREGHISATLAKQISKNSDPEKAAQLIKEMHEENRRIVGTKKRSTKVTRKTLERDKRKAETKTPSPFQGTGQISPPPPAVSFAEAVATGHADLPSALAATSDPQTPSFTPLSDETPPPHESHEQLQAAHARENGHTERVVTLPPVVAAPTPTYPNLKSIISAEITKYLATIAMIEEDNALAERDPSEKISVDIEVIGRGARLYRQIIGDTTADEAA